MTTHSVQGCQSSQMPLSLSSSTISQQQNLRFSHHPSLQNDEARVSLLSLHDAVSLAKLVPPGRPASDATRLVRQARAQANRTERNQIKLPRTYLQ